MKKVLMGLIALIISLTSFNVMAQKSIQTDEISQELVKEDLENGVVNFIYSIKTTISIEHKTYEEFKGALIGEANLNSITEEGEELLKTAYTLINSNANSEKIKTNGFKPFANAVRFVLEFESKEGNYSGVTLQNGSVALFGGNEDGLTGFAKIEGDDKGCGSTRECKWYQLGCHLHNIGVWICEHKNLLAGIYYTLGILKFFL